MDLKYLRPLLAAFVVAVLTGCAGVGSHHGGADHERLANAITMDDEHTIRQAVQTAVVTPNDRISVAGYPDGAPLIAIAARSASLQVLRFLISAGADLNARTPVNETPLMLASFFFDDSQQGPRAFERHEHAVRLLADAGADLENHYYYTPLAYAAYQGNERVVNYLIQRGARVNASAEQGGAYVNTPLMMAAIQGHERIARTLLRAGADADVRVYGGHTAAELAVKHNHRSLAQLLQCAQKQYGVAAFGPQCRQILGYDPGEQRQTLR